MLLETASQTSLSVELVTDERQLAFLAESWNQLLLNSPFPNVFMTYEWFRAWHERFAAQEPTRERHPYVLLLRKNGVLSGITPLVRVVSRRGRASVRHLQFAAREWDYNDLVVGDPSAEHISAVLGFLGQQQNEWDFVDLRDVRPLGALLPTLAPSLAPSGLRLRLLGEEERSPFMTIGSWSDVLSRYSRSTRRSLRHSLSRLQRLAPAGLSIRLIEHPEAETALLERMIAVEAQKRVGGQASIPFLGRYPEVFASLFAQLGPQGWLTIAVLELGERLLAWHLLFRCDNRLWGYLTAYDHEFAHLSPGTMLIPSIIDYGFAHGFEEYDFMSGEEPYKMRWATAIREKYRIFLGNPAWSSRLRTAAYFQRHREDRIAIPRWQSGQPICPRAQTARIEE